MESPSNFDSREGRLSSSQTPETATADADRRRSERLNTSSKSGRPDKPRCCQLSHRQREVSNGQVDSPVCGLLIHSLADG